MKVTVDSPETESKKINYPLLMQFKKNPQIIVLFIEKGKGTVIQNSDHKTGTYRTDWLEEENWTPYKGKITLEND